MTREVMSADAFCTLLELCGVSSQGAGLKKQEGVILQEGNFGPFE